MRSERDWMGHSKWDGNCRHSSHFLCICHAGLSNHKPCIRRDCQGRAGSREEEAEQSESESAVSRTVRVLAKGLLCPPSPGANDHDD